MADIEQSLQEIQQERSRLLTAKENLKTAITGKGVNVADDVKLDQYYTLVNSIQVGVEGGIDVSATTATEADVLSSAKFYKADGTFVNGTIQTVTASMSEGKVTVPVGYIGQEQTFEVAGDADLSFITAGANQILSGYIGSDKDGNQVQGAIVTRTENDVTANGTVVVAEGYYPTPISKTLTASTASVAGNVVEITTGWNDYKKVTVGTALPGGMNITPSATADYVLHKDSFITNGNITLAKEPNYLEENIREGVTMWGKTGTYKGEGGGSETGSLELYKCTAVQEASWSGRLVEIDEDTGLFSFAKSVTTGLHIGNLSPVVENVYDKNCIFRVSDYIANATLVFAKTFNNDSMVADTGDTLTLSYGTKNVTTIDGVPCWQFDGNTRVDFDAKDLPTGTKARTLSVFLKTSITAAQAVVSYGNNIENEQFSLMLSNDRISIQGYNNGEHLAITTPSEWRTAWQHIAITFVNDSWTAYINGVSIGSVEHPNLNTGSALGSIGGQANPESIGAVPFKGYIAEVKVWDEVLPESEIKAEADRCLAIVSSAAITFDGIYDSKGNKVDTMTFKYGFSASYTLRATASNGSTCTFAWASVGLPAPPCLKINSNGTVSTSNFDIYQDTTNSYPFKISADGCEDLTVDVSFTFQSCVHPDSLVLMADGSEKKIRDIQVGESVMSINPETGEFEPDTVIRNEYDGQRTFPLQDRWIFSDGTELITLARHRIYNVDRGAYVYMDAWRIGDVARKYDGTKTVLIGHEVINEPEVMATIRLKNNTYIVNGLLTGTRDAVPVTPFDKTGA